MITFHFYGHACFSLVEDQTTLLFDPYLTDNPFQIAQPTAMDCNYILVSHGHSDHLGDTINIAKRTGATVISTAEIANLCANSNCKTHGMHIGGKHTFDFGSVRITPAFHGSGIAGGHAAGFIVKLADKTIYYAGDTSLFGDMELLGRLETIDLAILPIGDNFTMGIDDAVEAVRLLKPKQVIPVHYNTWPLIKQSPEEFQNKVRQALAIPVHIVAPGESFTIAQ
jgi:L-ascorbate metabolism protein UlaG (beta-lactamase superfamily)